MTPAAKVEVNRDGVQHGALVADIMTECRHHYIQEVTKYVGEPMWRPKNPDLMLGLIVMLYIMLPDDWELHAIPTGWGVPIDIMTLAFDNNYYAH